MTKTEKLARRLTRLESHHTVAVGESCQMPKEPLIPEAQPTKQSDHGAEAPVFGRFSRRSFLGQFGAASLAATTSALAVAAPAPAPIQDESTVPAKPTVPGAVPMTLNINGREVKTTLEPRVTLLDALRED